MKKSLTSPNLSNVEELKDPAISTNEKYKTCLTKMEDVQAYSIARSIVSALTAKPSIINENTSIYTFDWTLQCVGYALRIDDSKESPSTFLMAIDIILDWLDRFPLKKSMEILLSKVRTLFIYLSQAFLNPSYYPASEKLPVCLKRILNASRHVYDIPTWEIIIQVLLIGSYRQAHDENSTSLLASVAVDCFLYPFLAKRDFLWKHDPSLHLLLPLASFRSIWIKKFEDVYKARLVQRFLTSSPSSTFAEQLELIIEYLMHTINSYFERKAKFSAFISVISCWKAISDEWKASQYTVVLKWPTEELLSHFIGWYSLEDDIMRSSSPLFTLISSCDCPFHPQLTSLADSFIQKVLSSPFNNETEAYWLLPVYARDYLMKISQDPNSTVESFVPFLSRLLQSSHRDDSSIICSVLFILSSAFVKTKHEDMNIYIASSFVVSSSDHSADLVSLVSLLFLDQPKLFWTQAARLLEKCNNTSSISLIAIAIGLASHVSGSSFSSKYPDPIPHISKIIKLATSSTASSTTDRMRCLFALILLANGTRHLYYHNEYGISILESIDNCSGDVGILSEMLRMTLISGGGSYTWPGDPKKKKKESSEIYFTDRYIVTIADGTSIVLRHALGFTKFDINDIEISDLVTVKREFKSLEREEKQLEIDDPEYDEILNIEREFACTTPFSKCEPYVQPKHASVAHSILVDMGMLPYVNNNTVRRIPHPSHIIEQLDLLPITPLIELPIAQLIQLNGREYIIDSVDTPLLQTVCKNLSKTMTKEYEGFREFIFETNVFQVGYIVNALSSTKATRKPTEYARESGILILINESDAHLNPEAADISGIDMIIMITPDDSYFSIELLCLSGYELIKGFPSRPVKFLTSIDKLGPIVAFYSILYLCSSKVSKKRTKGVELFCEVFKSRKDKIAEICSPVYAGRSAVMQSAVICGKTSSGGLSGRTASWS